MKKDYSYVSVNNNYIQSPLNYTGGKYKLLPQIIPHFPKDINKFFDLFCGGGNVGININCDQVVLNDRDSLLIGLLSTFKQIDRDRIFQIIEQIIRDYKLSNSSEKGYKYYFCDSMSGLGKHNKAGYLKLRSDFNKLKVRDHYYYLMLYVLIVFSFNNQIRFNSSKEFNLPVGKRDFNKKMAQKLNDFIAKIQSNKIILSTVDFQEIDTTSWDDKTLVYCDPPYLITCAPYNELNGWSELLEHSLLSFLDKLHEKGIRFALSNVLRSKGRENTILLNWLKTNGSKYRVIKLSYSYRNSNYQTKDKTTMAEEVLIVNY